jgi:hypothetical protein
MLKKVLRFGLLVFAGYGIAVAVSKVSQKMKLKKSGGNPADVKLLK